MGYTTNVSIEIEGKNAGKTLKTLLSDEIVEAEDDANYAIRSLEIKYVDLLLKDAQKLSETEKCNILLTGDGEEKTDTWATKFVNGEKVLDVTFHTLLEHYTNTEKIKVRVEAVGENAADALKELFGLEKINHTTLVKYINVVDVFVENAMKISKNHNVILKVYGIKYNGFDMWYRQFEQGKIVYFKDFFSCVENDPVRTAPRPEPGKEVIEKKSYHFEMTNLRDGTTKLTRVNHGFNALELLGLLSMATTQITDSLGKAGKPDELERKYEKADRKKD